MSYWFRHRWIWRFPQKWKPSALPGKKRRIVCKGYGARCVHAGACGYACTDTPAPACHNQMICQPEVILKDYACKCSFVSYMMFLFHGMGSPYRGWRKERVGLGKVTGSFFSCIWATWITIHENRQKKNKAIGRKSNFQVEMPARLVSTSPPSEWNLLFHFTII